MPHPKICSHLSLVAIQWGAADTWKYDFADKNFDFEIEFELFDDEATPAVRIRFLLITYVL